jgi:Fe-S-cluster containining protein
MKPSLTDTLCTRCGLCCGGSLFADVELAGHSEATAMEILRLNVEEGEGESALLLQPCAALKGKRCSIYPHRPGCCRTFECRLLQQVKRGTLTVDHAAEKIAEMFKAIERVERLAAQFGQRNARLPLKERYTDALANSADRIADPKANRKRKELNAAMVSVERMIQETFLGI